MRGFRVIEPDPAFCLEVRNRVVDLLLIDVLLVLRRRGNFIQLRKRHFQRADHEPHGFLGGLFCVLASNPFRFMFRSVFAVKRSAGSADLTKG